MTNTFIAATCPQCSGSLQLPADLDSAKCSYCGATVLITKSANTDVEKKKNLLELARACQEGGSHKEAYEFFSEILKIDSSDPDAWEGLGTSAGWQSNLINDRFDEMKNCHKKALQLSQEGPGRTVRSMMIGAVQYQIALEFFNLSHEHVMQFIAVRNAQFEHADRICRVIDICENAKSLDPDLDVEDFISDIAKRGAGILMLDRGTKEYLDSKIRKKEDKRSQSMAQTDERVLPNSDTGSPWLGLIGLGILVAAGLTLCSR